MTFPASFNLASLNGLNGFNLTGEYNNGNAGTSLGSGDINGDGIADLLIGSPYGGPNSGALATWFLVRAACFQRLCLYRL